MMTLAAPPAKRRPGRASSGCKRVQIWNLKLQRCLRKRIRSNEMADLILSRRLAAIFRFEITDGLSG
jgi:hypothetical protein